MKKALYLLLSLLLVAALVCSCAPQPEPTPAPGPTPGPTPTPGPNEEGGGGNEGENDPPEPEPFSDPIDPANVVYNTVEYPYTDEDGAIHIAYQDVYTIDLSDNELDSIASETVTSTVCGETTPDTHVVTIDKASGKVTAVGCGTAQVVTMRGVLSFVVEPAPINLLFVSGQSNAEGAQASSASVSSADYAKYFKRSPDRMAYFTYTYHGLDCTSNENTMRTPPSFVVKTLKWGNEARYSSYKNGPNVTTLCDPLSNFGNVGFCAALASEWIEQTGERVWVVNASHGGHPINNFIPLGEENAPELRYNDYEQAKAVYALAMQTMENEVAAGHFTLHHMVYYWCQGESDSGCRDDYYLDAFETMHTHFMNDVVYHRGQEDEKTLEFCGLVTVRSCKDNSGNSLSELYMIGPRIAQYEMNDTKTGPLANVYVVSNCTEAWVDKDENVVNYLTAKYGSAEQFKDIFGYNMPTTMKQMHPEIHYAIGGQNEVGMDMAKNSLLILNRLNPADSYRVSYTDEQTDVSVRLLGLDGYTELTSVQVDTRFMSGYVIPRITPLYRSVDGVTMVSETAGATFDLDRLVIDPTVCPKSVTFTVSLHGKFLAKYTLPIVYASFFSQGGPVQFAVGGGDLAENPERSMVDIPGQPKSDWDAGYLNYATGKFTVFTVYDSDSWLHMENETKWTSNWHGGFMGSGYLIASSSPTTMPNEDVGFRYTVTRNGVLNLRVEALNANLQSFKLCVWLNGEPQSEVYTVSKRLTTLDDLNEFLSEVVLEVETGDEVVLCFTNTADGVSQATCLPYVFYD